MHVGNICKGLKPSTSGLLIPVSMYIIFCSLSNFNAEDLNVAMGGKQTCRRPEITSYCTPELNVYCTYNFSQTFTQCLPALIIVYLPQHNCSHTVVFLVLMLHKVLKMDIITQSMTLQSCSYQCGVWQEVCCYQHCRGLWLEKISGSPFSFSVLNVPH